MTQLEDQAVKRWDEWFELVGMSNVWVFFKNVFADDHERLMMWAAIIELDRIKIATEERNALLSN